MLLDKHTAHGALTPGINRALRQHFHWEAVSREPWEWVSSPLCVPQERCETLSVLPLQAIFAGSQGQECECEYISAPGTPGRVCTAVKAALQEAQLSTAHQAERAAELCAGIWCAATGLPVRAPWSQQKYLIRSVSCNCHVEKTRLQIGFVWSMGKKDHFIHLSSAA